MRVFSKTKFESEKTLRNILSRTKFGTMIPNKARERGITRGINRMFCERLCEGGK